MSDRISVASLRQRLNGPPPGTPDFGIIGLRIFKVEALLDAVEAAHRLTRSSFDDVEANDNLHAALARFDFGDTTNAKEEA